MVLQSGPAILPMATLLVLIGSMGAIEAAPQPAVLPHGEPMVLILADEFESDEINWEIWESLRPGDEAPKRSTLRGPDNLEVRDGNLLLHVRKEKREHEGRTTDWTAAWIYTREPIPNNVYLETRFLPSRASGVNNAFWLNCIASQLNDPDWWEERVWRDFYEIDIVETRQDIRRDDGAGYAHLAWHDWKTYRSLHNADGSPGHIAQGIHIHHPWDEYQTWGLWYGEEEMIWYLNGREVWRGRTHSKLHDQWWSGVGKYDEWPTAHEKSAYGHFGQADWSYNGGYTGDRMHVCFSTLPWGSTWSPLTDEAHDTYMAIDYFRMYKPKRILETEPLQRDVTRITLGPGESHSLSANPVIPVDAPHPHYFSMIVKRDEISAFTMATEVRHSTPIWKLSAEQDGALSITLDLPSRTARTSDVYPVRDRNSELVPPGEETLLVVRMTPALRDGKTGISAKTFVLTEDLPEWEPYFHSNIDPHGNTSLNNQWDLNLKGFVVEEGTRFHFTSTGEGTIEFHGFRQGRSFRSVLPE